MPVETIKIIRKEDPKSSAELARGRIKAEDGRLFQATRHWLNLVNLGSTYDVSYKDDQFNGERGLVKFRVVESLAPAIGGVSNRQPANATYDGPSRHTPEQNAPGNQPSTDDILTEFEKQIDISVLSLFRDLPEWSKKIPSGDEATLTHVLWQIRKSWIGHKRKKSSDKIESGKYDDMADEISEF